MAGVKAVEIRGLSYSYPDGRAALSGLDLDVAQGETVGLLGPNGAGKTTLLLHLNGILRGSGAIKVLGLDLNDSNLRTIRGKVGLVLQDPEAQLFCPTLFDDVAFGPINMGLPEPEVRARAEEALAAMGMAGSETRSPHHLSMGEKRRAAIATVLSMRPELLVVDEPSANLDPRSRRELIALMEGLQVTKIVASHDLGLVGRLCGRAVLLNGGKVAADGGAGEILADARLLAENGL